ncbi:hypothetical protein M8C21_030517 [Ambrosia artemisiifolia]|uniref:Uncharacterized protein n=1 Tax=Ambrosia artemisiifolia TaxID=4212 RepID=A0AAD5G206_AMBAR|nr:hypothetical protein M8C21_030517 [Ambrosia artemisiifolia]
MSFFATRSRWTLSLRLIQGGKTSYEEANLALLATWQWYKDNRSLLWALVVVIFMGAGGE